MTTRAPGGASASSFWAEPPVAERTAPPAGIGVPPPWVNWTTFPLRSLPGGRIVGGPRRRAPRRAGPRRHQHGDDNGPVRREQKLARISESRHERLRGRARRRGEDARQQHCDEDPAQQNLTPREGSAIT